MKYLVKAVPVVWLITISQWAYSSSITDNYATGDNLTAATLENIKSAVNDNDQRISNSHTSDFSGFSQPFAALGDPKNVIVLVRENGDFTKTYSIRSRYHNNTEQVSVDGVLMTPSLIAHYDVVTVDANGVVTDIRTYIEVPETESYTVFTTEMATLDINTHVKTVTTDNQSEDQICTGGGAISTCNWTISTSGTPTYRSNSVLTFTLLGEGTVSGMTFDSLRSELSTYLTEMRNIVRAKGIGEVLRQNPGTPPRVAIYYYANGETDGSLDGTPFATGGELEGVLF